MKLSWVMALLCLCPLVAAAQAGSGSSTGDEADQSAEAGQKALASGNYWEAQTNFEKLARLEPGVAEVHATLAVIDFKLRNYDEAVSEIRRAQKLKPGLPRLDSLLGMSLAELGRFSEALPGLEKGFKQTADKEIRRMSGLQLLRAYTGLHRDSDAVETGLALNKDYPADPEILYQTGRIFGNYAYIVMEKLHDEAPGSIWMLQAQGEAYESQKDYDSAIAAFTHVLAIDPRRPGIHYRMGRVYLRRFRAAHEDKDRLAAAQEFGTELGLDPSNGNAVYELAQIYYDMGNLEQARQEFEALLARHPEFEQAHVGLAGVLIESHKPELAVPQLKSAIALDKSDEVAWYRLARALRATGDVEGQAKAMTEFQRLHKIASDRVAKTGIVTDSGDVTPQQLGEQTQP